ncbi:hypothetical protein BDV93DRAFT_606146 [Ceratobasidium sp. AG-I]|nr:hypothetical protein BDV93DRAFT_606146 [Ceratobasidium sp. AG-I]
MDTEGTPILDSRPSSTTGLPIQLYHNAFEMFTGGISGTEPLDPLVCVETERFPENAQAIYPYEAERQDVAIRDFVDCYDMAFAHEEAEDCRADGVIKTAVSDLQTCCAILKLHNEIGASTCDPSVQAPHSCTTYRSQAELAPLRKICCCPSFIIAMAGPWMCTLGGGNHGVTSDSNSLRVYFTRPPSPSDAWRTPTDLYFCSPLHGSSRTHTNS